MTDELHLRTGLPDALRILLQDYPRDGWSAHPNNSGLIMFWLDRHMMFRRLLQAMTAETEKALDNAMEARTFAARLSRYGGMFVGELHGHHQIEDVHYFPELKRLDARLEQGFELLDRDHHAIDGLIAAFAEDANAVLQGVQEGGDWRRAAGALQDRLAATGAQLDRHLVDEEDLIVPVLLHHAPGHLS